MKNIFEQATRIKLRFHTSKGMVSIDDLWDMPLSVIKDFGRSVNSQLKSMDNDVFGDTVPNADNDIIQLQFDVIKHIVDTRNEESASKLAAKEIADKKQRLLEIISRKQDAELEGKSLDDLKKEVSEL